MVKPNLQSVKAELDTLTALSQERFIELLNRTKRLETVLVAASGTTIVLLVSLLIK
tara:strand:+ start:555 stop:722 length:168 start_codon:yes stop_codon:yes gene_type:complete